MSHQGGTVTDGDVGLFHAWNRYKIHLHITERSPVYFREREVWWAALGKNIGHEINGKHRNFERPVIVVKVCSSDLCLILPITSQVKRRPYLFPLTLGGRLLAVNISQVRTISRKRFLRKLGKLTWAQFLPISSAFFKYIKINGPDDVGVAEFPDISGDKRPNF